MNFEYMHEAAAIYIAHHHVYIFKIILKSHFHHIAL